MEENKNINAKFKIFDLYDSTNIEIKDEGLKNVINTDPKLMLKNHGRNVQKFGQIKINIIERIASKLGVAGHRGKKHKLEKGIASGKYSKNMKIVIEALKLIEDKTKQNPIQVVVRAIENSAPKDEVTVIEYGGARYPQAVDVAPLRRVSLAVRNIVACASDKAFNKKKTLSQALAEEIILASENNGESFAVRKRNESEKQADSAR